MDFEGVGSSPECGLIAIASLCVRNSEENSLRRRVFTNLWSDEAFRDHNFSNFYADFPGGRIEEVSHDWILASVRKSYEDRDGLEPYFDSILPYTLSPKCCASFLRAYSNLPVDQRDYYLSKLFQFIYLTLEVRFSLQGAAEMEVKEKVQDLLDRVPDELLPPLGDEHVWERVWELIYHDTRSLRLRAVLDRLPEHLKTVLHGTRNAKTRPEKELSRRRRGPKPDMESHRKVAQIVGRCGPNWQDQTVLEKVCRALDKSKIPPSKSWEKWSPAALSWERALQNHPEHVIKAIAYRLQKAGEEGS